MSKNKNNNRNALNLSGVNPVQTITEHTNKKGKLTGSKKEVKALRSICTHHVMTKKGKLKPQLHDEGNKYCQCPICRERIRTAFYSDQEYDAARNPFKEIASQEKFLAQATGAGKQTMEEILTLNVAIDRNKKLYQNLRAVAEKKDKIKKKKKNNTYNGMGGWRIS